MNVLGLLGRLRILGVELKPDGEQLRYRAPKGVLTEDLRLALVQHKTEILACLLSAERFGQPHAALFPLIGKRVETPDGPGVLVQVFESCARVLSGGDRASEYPPTALLSGGAEVEGSVSHSSNRLAVTGRLQ